MLRKRQREWFLLTIAHSDSKKSEGRHPALQVASKFACLDYAHVIQRMHKCHAKCRNIPVLLGTGESHPTGQSVPGSLVAGAPVLSAPSTMRCASTGMTSNGTSISRLVIPSFGQALLLCNARFSIADTLFAVSTQYSISPRAFAIRRDAMAASRNY